MNKLAVWTHLETEAGPETRVEAMPDGWVWAAPIANNRLSVLMICAPATVRRRANGDAEEMLRENLAKTALLRNWARAPFARRPVVCDATCAYAAEPIGAGYIKIGEAAYSLDPLSSTGVEKALQTALHCAAVVHTAMDHPERVEVCRRFYQERQRETVHSHTAWAGEFYHEVKRYAAEPFWESRRARIQPVHGTPAPTPRPDPTLDSLVKLAPGVSITEEPCIVGGKIEARAGIRSPFLDRPLVYLDGVEIAPLLAELSPGITLRHMLSCWSLAMGRSRALRFAGRLWEMRVLCHVGEDYHPASGGHVSRRAGSAMDLQ